MRGTPRSRLAQSVSRGSRSAEQLTYGVGRLGSGVEVALPECPSGAEEGPLLFGLLDAFGDRLQPEVVGELGDGFDELYSARAVRKLRGKGSIDLHRVKGKTSQVGQGGESGPEVVESEPNAELFELCQSIG